MKAVNNEKEERAKKELKVLSKYIIPNTFIIMPKPIPFFDSFLTYEYRISKKDFAKAGKELGYWENEENILNYISGYFKQVGNDLQIALHQEYFKIERINAITGKNYAIIEYNKPTGKYLQYYVEETKDYLQVYRNKEIDKETAKKYLNEIEKAGKYKEELKQAINDFLMYFSYNFGDYDIFSNIFYGDDEEEYDEFMKFSNMHDLINCMRTNTR
jgi:transglutaminase-like putative cysteine protease